MEFEKTYFPLFLLGKKRYCGIKYESVDVGKRQVMGMEATRRDNCLYLKSTQLEFIDKLCDNKPEEAMESLRKRIFDLAHGKVPIEQLVISKKFGKTDYKNVQIHVELNDRIKKRTPALAYSLGSRIPYVVVKGSGPLAQRGEDADFITKHNIPIDLGYYLDKQIVAPMLRLVAPLVGTERATLFFQRAPQRGIHDHFTSSRSTYVPRLLAEGEQDAGPAKKKKKTAVPQKRTLDSYFK